MFCRENLILYIKYIILFHRNKRTILRNPTISCMIYHARFLCNQMIYFKSTSGNIDLSDLSVPPVSSLLAPPKRSSLVDLAYDAIVEAIVDSKFLAGTRLNVDALASQLDMSNTPIREALVRATTQGLVQQESNRGFTVAPKLSKQEVLDLFGVRRILEVYGLRHAQLNDDTLNRLQELAIALQQSDYGPTYKSFKNLLDVDRWFHMTLLHAANNQFLAKSWDNLHFYIHISRLHTTQGAFGGEDFHASMNDHMQIVQLLREKRQDEAVDALDKHIHDSQNRLLRLIEG